MGLEALNFRNIQNINTLDKPSIALTEYGILINYEIRKKKYDVNDEL